MVAFTFGRYGYPSIYGSSYGTSYNPASTYRSPYGSTYGAGYGSGYGSSAYKTSYSAVSVAPLCKSDGRMMLRVYVVEGGLPVSNAKVSYVDNKVLDTVSTDQYGYIAIPVYGCTVALMVYHKDDNPVYRTVDLMSSKTREEKVVIKVDDKCNFNLYFAYQGESDCVLCGEKHQKVCYMFASEGYTGNADHTGYECAVAQVDCITVGDEGANLKVMLKSQVGNHYNVLDITITDSRSAVIGLPPQLDDEKEYDLVFTSNTYEKNSEVLNEIKAWRLIQQYDASADEIDDTDTGISFTDVFSAGVEKDNMKDKKWLLAVEYETSVGPGTGVDLEGCVTVIDSDGNYQTAEHPDAGSDYTEDSDWFPVGCFCNNAPSTKPGDFFPIGGVYEGTEADLTYDKWCNAICNDNL